MNLATPHLSTVLPRLLIIRVILSFLCILSLSACREEKHSGSETESLTMTKNFYEKIDGTMTIDTIACVQERKGVNASDFPTFGYSCSGVDECQTF